MGPESPLFGYPYIVLETHRWILPVNHSLAATFLSAMVAWSSIIPRLISYNMPQQNLHRQM